ncbi:ABC transporter permease [Oscillospiraceae bacterium LTW-04]|nr:ABC transporter permease [Oscillospiraceae bacterium MB24-C1]
MKTFYTMLKTELKLSLRGMDMFIFAICMPLVLLVILGMLYGSKPAYDGASYTFLEQSFAALTTISICAGGVMGLPLVVSDYRSKKILKRFQVTPISPILILLVQITIYTLYAVVSLLSLILISMVVFDIRFQGTLLNFLGGYFLVMLSMFSIGMMVGGVARDSKVASAVASLLYFPMIILSGATLPYEIMPIMLQKVSDVLPLTQGIKILKAASLGLPLDSVLIPFIAMVILAGVCIGISLKYFRWE